MAPGSELVVFSHLRWNFVYQRPQHLLSRMARERRVIFVEEPIQHEGPPRWDISQPEPSVQVCTPRTPLHEPGYHPRQIEQLSPMLEQLRNQVRWRDPIAWYYTPMALELGRRIDPALVVYDCMDELSAFRGAPRELIDHEKQLLQLADLVFTGGPSLFNAKRSLHPSVHCFPSSVDRAHFALALDGIDEPADQRDLPHPRLGFYGVIDERMDLALLDTLARSRPDWQIIMVGPVVKIDPDHLPRHPNLHYLGQRDYKQLPNYLKGWDVALLPFAMNESTRFISPTKTLEYMAAQRLIVSTPITDVAEPYGHIVEIADQPEQFVAACDAALNWPEHERRQRLQLMQQVVEGTSWDRTARAMNQLITDALAAASSSDGANTSGATDTPDSFPACQCSDPDQSTDQTSRSQSDVVIIGAGPTGLSAAYHLGPRALLLERNNCVGGWCRSIYRDGFTFDFAGHIMFSNDPYVHQMYKMLLGENVHWQNREAWIYSKNVYTRYPFQGALFGLPADVIKECIVGAIEARFGSVKKSAPTPERPGRKSAGDARSGSAPACEGDVKDCCADGILEASAKLGTPAASGPSDEPRNFEEFIYKVWGAGIARHFAIPYNRKLWAVPLTEMETSWLGGRVPLPDLEEMIEGALRPVPRPMGPNARFGYPLKGGFQALMNGFLPYVEDQLVLGAQVVKVSPRQHTVQLADGRELSYQQLISTMPLPLLIKAMGDEAPQSVRDAANSLRHVSVRCVHIGVGREALTEKHWIYYPEDTVFHRIFVQGNASPHCNPQGGFGLTCEITYSPSKPLPCDGQALIDRCIADCRRVGFFKDEDPVWTTCQVDMPFAYVVYDHDRKRHVDTIRTWLEQHDILLSGRYSEWEYYNSDHAFIAGKKAAEMALKRLSENRKAA